MNQIILTFMVMAACQMTYGATEEAGHYEVLHKKCLVELKYHFVPSNCFRWMRHSSINSAKKVYLQDWFSSVCRKAMKKDENQVQYHVRNIGLMSKDCQKSLEEAFEQWSYKSKSDDPERVMELLARSKVGKDFEYSDTHDLEKTKRNRNLRGDRRRLN